MTPPCLRPLEARDLARAHALTRSFDWPHRLEDWAAMHAIGEGLVAERDGVVLGTAMAWRHGTDQAMIGLITVDAAQQGQGIGRLLVQGLIDALPGYSLSLHATAAGMPLYQTLGFAETGRVLQHQGIVTAPPLPIALRAITPDDIDTLRTLDRATTGMDRTTMLRALLADATGVMLDPDGFALIRRFGRGALIGPVVAPSAAAARTLVASLLAPCAGRYVRIDVPAQSGLSDWLLSMGLLPAGGGVRMTRGSVPPADDSRLFGLASQALG